MIYRIEHIFFPGKTHLCFGRVDVHIHQLRRHLDGKHTAREFSLHHHAFISSLQRRHHRAVLDKASIDKKILHGAACTGVFRRRNKAAHRVAARRVLHRHKVLCKITGKHGIRRPQQFSVAGRLELRFSVPHELERNLRVGERKLCDNICHIVAFTGILFQKLHTCGRVVKQVPHSDRCSDRTCGRLDALFFSPADAVQICILVRICLCEKLNAGHTGHASPRKPRV